MATEPLKHKIPLTSHQKKTFQSQTVVLSGHGFIKCVFKDCTVMVTNSPFVLKGCHFHNCNWRFEYDVLWGNPAHTRLLKQLLNLIEGGQVKDFSSLVH